MEWTDESITRLRSLWQEGLSTAEIGRRMQITKNAVVGKAHRLTLPPRPSPIRKGLELASTALQTQDAVSKSQPPVLAASERLVAPRPRPVPAPAALAPEVLAEAMQPVAVASVPVPVVAEPEWERTASNVQPLRPGVTEQGAGIIPARAAPQTVSAEPAPLRTVSATPTPRRRGLTCCWPLGEPGTKEFHFCGGDPAPGKPYCSQHAALAYVKLRDRRDSVA